MKGFLAPTLKQPIGALCILWFENSNQYIVIDKSLYTLIEAFLASENKAQFKEKVIKSGYDAHSANQFFIEIGQFLEDCNVISKEALETESPFSGKHRELSHYYQMDDKTIIVHYGSAILRSLVHPQLEHLETLPDKTSVHCEFDIYNDENRLVMFKDEKLIGSWNENEYHLLQGKFAIHILCALHRNEEMDWMGTFHASTVAKNNGAVMIIGESGKGKSTFTALLLGQGYEILADDITPILAKDSLVYPYPGGISIKAGSFGILKNSLPNFESLTEHYINPYKGFVKYVDAPKSNGYLKGYPCKTMVSINYKKDANTSLEIISVADALNTLIPESWLAHDIYNAQQFLNWIKDVKFYELTYSDTDEAIKVFSTLFTE